MPGLSMIRGLLGWSNKRSGLEFYRYDEKVIPRHGSEWGELLASSAQGKYLTEGSPVLVIVLPRDWKTEAIEYAEAAVRHSLDRLEGRAQVPGLLGREQVRQEIREHVEHIARGCRASTSHNPAVYERAIADQVDGLLNALEEAERWANTMEHERDWETQVVHSELLARAEAAESEATKRMEDE